ncbi:MAG: DNA translocase FtsK [Acidimicrobiales bacterium]|nr:DNA translocase FtsK [Acidimicrobiales bacterium]
MATKTAPKSTSGRARSSTKSASSRSRSSGADGGRRRHAKKSPAALWWRKVLASGQAWGALLVVAGLISGLGIYLDAAGPAGFAAETGLGVLLGILRYIAPPLIIAAGALLLRGPRAHSHSAGRVHPGALAVVLVVTVAALLHVFRGAGGSAAAKPLLDRLEDAGGLLGMGVALPLVAATGRPASAVLLGVAAVALVMVLARVTPAGLARGLARGWASITPDVGERVGSLFRAVEDPERSTAVASNGERPRRRPPAHRLAGSELDDAGAQGEAPEGTAGAADPPSNRRRKVEVQVPATDDLPADSPLRAGEPVEERVIPITGGAFSEPAVEDAGPDGEESGADDLIGGGLSADPAVPKVWKLPPVTVLGRSGAQEVDRLAVERAGRTLEHALAEHGVETRLVGMVVGPTVTRYELELGPGVKVARVTSLHRDIAYAMATPDVRILAPIPGRQAIGVEVPNADRQLVTIGDILGSEEARRADHPLEVAIGRDIAGRSVLANLAKMPHVLIAGATGAGKSSCINCLITSILMRSTPDEVRMILIDPKRVELGQYNRLPHLLTQVVTNPKKAANALNWAVREMERRYDLLSEVGVRDITGYNAAYDRGDLQGERSETLAKTLGFNNPDVDVTFPRLPYVLIVVDELNDLMMVAARDVEDAICRIAQMARAVGIHLVVATQRPSVNVITGVIKANIPARLAFAVSSLADSRVILDQAGAERLVGRGDMLIIDGSSSTAQRLQGAWVTEEEVRAVAAHWRRQSPETNYVQGVEGSDEGDQLDLFSGGGAGATGDEDDDELFRQARELVVRSQFGSTSMLQRKLRVGFARAGRLMDLLEQAGVVGPSTGSKAREVLMSPEELDEQAAPAG